MTKITPDHLARSAFVYVRPADAFREDEERNDVLPGAPPALRDGRILPAPEAGVELLKGLAAGLHFSHRGALGRFSLARSPILL